MSAPGLLLLDAPSVWYRSFHGVPTSVTGPHGRPVNAVRGYFEVLARQLRETGAAACVSCLDVDWRPAFRVELLPTYKAHRVAADGSDGAPAELGPQIPVIESVLDALGLARCGAAGLEADDVIGTLCARAVAAGRGPVDVVTGDRDLFQLVRDDPTGATAVRIRYSVQKFQLIDEAELSSRFGIPGRGYGEYATLRGDASDGLPGVPGVGEKAASALVSRFGTVEAMLAALDAGQTEGFPAGARNRLAAARDYLAVAPRVVRVVHDAELPEVEDRVPAEPRHPERLVELVDTHGLTGPVNRVLAAMAAANNG